MPIRISSSPREVAQNDLDGGLFQWFTKKANEERNIAYYLYRQPFTVQEYDSEGNKLTTPKVECTPRAVSYTHLDVYKRQALNAMNKRNANRLALGAAGSTWLGRAAESASQALTGETMFDRQNRMLKDQEDFVKSAGAFQKDLKAEAIKGKYGPVSVDGGGNYLGGSQIITGNSKTLRAQAQVAIANGLSKFKYDDGAGNVYDVSTTDYETIASDMERCV